MSRSTLWKELKTLNPRTLQKWPHVSISSIQNELKQLQINKQIKKAYYTKKRFERKNIKKVAKFLQNPEENKSITLNKDQLIHNISKLKLNQKYLLEINYSLTNGSSVYRILTSYKEIRALLKDIKEGIIVDFNSLSTNSDVEEDLYIILLFNKYFTLKWFNRDNYHKTNNGSYFKYYHNLKIDLSKYQVYKKSQKIDYETCLYYAFKQSGITRDILDQLKFLIQEKSILLRELNKISEVLQYKIEITYMDINNKTSQRVYGKEFEQTIKLGLVDEHYFINELTNYTSEILTKKRDSRNRKISSYTLIRGLINNKDKLLKPITIENINNREHFLSFNSDYELRDLTKTEYKPYNKISKSQIFQGIYKEYNDNPNYNYKLCFVDLETYNDEYHKPYCLGYSYENEDSINCIYGLDCVTKFLDSLKTNTVIITHNLGFDFRGFINHLSNFQTPIETGMKLKSIQCKYKFKHLLFKDNYSFLPFKLSALPKMFKLQSGDKGIYPYTLITKDNIDKNIPLNEVLTHLKETDHNDFIYNCNKVNCLNNNLVDIKKYTIYYCNQDINILKQAYLTFRTQIKEITNLDILKLISLPQLADEYFKTQNVYDDCYKIGGVSQDFIRKAVHGGRVMTSENKKFHIKDKIISDFDAVSLYPSAMNILPGYIKGIPKLITNQDWFNQDYYFVEIEILDIKIKRNFPLISIIENGIKNYTNDVINHKLVVDKITLEDLIKYHKIEYKFIRGYYFNEGFNTKIKTVIEFMFNERIKLKNQGNSLQNAYKLILNASYGKLIQKPIKTLKKFYEGNYRNYVIRNASTIINYHKINENLICINQKKTILNHMTGCHIAAQILSMSKRIMNKVIATAEDENLKIYYQDTDSIHIETKDIKILSDKYQDLYNQTLIGKQMGQFHSDFEVQDADKDFEINAIESIFLGKKAYIDKLQYKQNNEIKYTYHIRLKGISTQIIKNYNEDIMQTYIDLYNGKELEFNLVSCCPLELTRDYKAINRTNFKRKIKF